MLAKRAHGFILILLLALLSVLPGANHVWAQTGETWDRTAVIAGEQSPGMWPTVVADAWGRVHVFWTQYLDQENLASPAIMHRMKDAAGWHEPVDIMLRDPWIYSYPNVVLGKERAYMMWAETNGLYFSSAPLWQMGDASAWQPKSQVAAMSGIDQTRMEIDSKSVVHAVFSRLAAGTNGDGQLYYISTADGGDSWSTPIPISEPGDPTQEANLLPRMAIDKDDRVHVVWTTRRAPEWIGRDIFYTHSTNGSEAWLPPTRLSRPNIDRSTWEDAPNLAIDHQGTLHVVWACQDAERCYRFSNDGGANWSEIQRILGDMRSLAGWDSLVVDDQDRLHLIAQLRLPENIYHATKLPGQSWSAPVGIITDPDIYTGHYPSAALALGNQLLIVTQPDKPGKIYFAAGQLTCSAATPQPTPHTPLRVVATPTARPPRTPEVARSVALTSTLVEELRDLPDASASDDRLPIALAIIPPFLFVAAVVAARLATRR